MRVSALKVLCATLCIAWFTCLNAQTANGISGMTFSADTYRSNLQTGVTNAEGNFKMKIGDQSIEADSAEINSQTGIVTGRGHIVFNQGSVNILAEEIAFNTGDGLGNFKKAILRKEGELYIEARKLSRIGDFRYQGHDVKLSTCMDCPQSWSVAGSFADIEIEAYAEIHHALLQVRDAPILYFPVFIFPIKTKRQSGFLAPQIITKNVDLGYQFKLPYYWAYSKEGDATLSYEYATLARHRMMSEWRYAFSNRSFVDATGSMAERGALSNVADQRYGYSVQGMYQLSSQLSQRFRGELASDTLYTTHYSEEFKGTLQPFLINEPSLTWQSNHLIASAMLRFNRDNLIRDESVSAVTGLDRLPELSIAMPTQKLFGPLRFNWETRHSSFRRKGLGIDEDTHWIREGDRSTVLANLRFGSNFFSYFHWDPLIQIRTDAYRFPQVPLGESESAYRLRIYFDQKLSTQIYRVYAVTGPDLKAVKHVLEPSLRWSWAPPDAKSAHSFFAPDNSPRFDLFDPNSPDTQQLSLGTVSEEQRLRKHHILTLGLATRVIGRYGEERRTYEEFFGARIDQDISLARETSLDGIVKNRFSPLKIVAFAAYGGLRLDTDIAIDFSNFANRAIKTNVRNDLSYKWSLYSIALKNEIQPNAKTLGYEASIKNYGPWSFITSQSFDFSEKAEEKADWKSTAQKYEINYNSASKCWYFNIVLDKKLNQSDADRFNVSLKIAPVFAAGVKTSFF